MDDRTRTLLGDVESQALRMRQHWAGMDDQTRLAAVNELNCRSQELYAVVAHETPHPAAVRAAHAGGSGLRHLG